MTIQHSRTSLACALLASALAGSAAAADGDMGPYFNFDAGPSFAQSVQGSSGGFSGTADLEVGGRFGMAFGYNFHRNFGVEFESGWTWNEFEDSAYSLTQVPFLISGVIRYPNRTRLEPYVSVGGGGVLSTFGVDDCCGDYDSDFVFGWQGTAGLRYKINDLMSLGLGYKYLGTAATDFNVYGIRTELETVHNHSVGVVFNMKF